MLSFDISAIDIVLLIAVIVLLLLSIQKRGQSSTPSQLPAQERDQLSEKVETKSQNTKKKLPTTQSPKGFRGCAHDFGYLKNLPKNTPVPDECFGCPQVMRCLFANEQDQLVQ